MITDKYLGYGKQILEKQYPQSIYDVEQWATEISQEICDDILDEEIPQLLQEHPEFLHRKPIVPEDPKDEYFTLAFMTYRISQEWLCDELEAWGKEQLTLRGLLAMEKGVGDHA